MKFLVGKRTCLFLSLFLLGNTTLFADNQTPDTTTILPESGLPFRIEITQANFMLPVGFHSGVVGVYKGFWIFIAGRTNGLHGFTSLPLPTNFPADAQNKSIYVVNPDTGAVSSRLLSDSSSGLSQAQIDTLSVTSPQGYQEGDTLYMTGGYGIDTSTSTSGTKPVLTAIYLPGIVNWVTHPENANNSVVKNIQQIQNPIFQVTGGKMYRSGQFTQLVFGQNFTGNYSDTSNGDYSKQVRLFQIMSVGGKLSVKTFPSQPQNPDPNFRRRDLNVLPALLNNNNLLKYSYVAYAGVFTDSGGVWTVPVIIDDKGTSSMANPNLPGTFKQGMNQYVCASAGLYSRKYASMFHVFFGGISYGYYSGGAFTTDPEDPFINQVTTIKIDKNNNFSQYLMSSQYPTLFSTGSNPGNLLYFGAGASFLPANIQKYPNKVIDLDNIQSPTVIGYIVGGIQSTVMNTNFMTDSAASPYVFKVTVVPN